METQQNLALDDPHARTQSEGLDVVYASASGSERFHRDSLFGGFSSMRALTYTPSIPMILALLRDYDYEDFECIFGHGGILSRDAADVLGFQAVVDEKLNKGFVGIKGLSEKRKKFIYDRAVDETVLCRLFRENLPPGAEIPAWCSPMTLSEYQERAFERPRLILANLLHADKYSGERKPPSGSWTLTGDTVIIAAEIMASGRMKSDIPDWILDDTASVADQIVLKRDRLESFLNQRVKRPNRWLRFLRN